MARYKTLDQALDQYNRLRQELQRRGQDQRATNLAKSKNNGVIGIMADRVRAAGYNPLTAEGMSKKISLRERTTPMTLNEMYPDLRTPLDSEYKRVASSKRILANSARLGRITG